VIFNSECTRNHVLPAQTHLGELRAGFGKGTLGTGKDTKGRGRDEIQYRHFFSLAGMFISK